MKVLICGDRHWKDKEFIRNAMQILPAGTVVIHGAARGADTIAGDIAKAMGLQVLAFPAQWNTLGKAAGPVRNMNMLGEGPDVVWAFHDNLNESRGTRNMIKLAMKRGVEVRVFEHGT